MNDDSCEDFDENTLRKKGVTEEKIDRMKSKRR